MHVHHDDTGMRMILLRLALLPHKIERLRTVAEYVEPVVVTVMIERHAQQRNVGGVVFHHQNPGGVCLVSFQIFLRGSYEVTSQKLDAAADHRLLPVVSTGYGS